MMLFTMTALAIWIKGNVHCPPSFDCSVFPSGTVSNFGIIALNCYVMCADFIIARFGKVILKSANVF